MKTVSTVLDNLLRSGRMFWMTEIFTFTLKGITEPIRVTSLDIDITVGSNLYKTSPIQRGSITASVGTSVDDLNLKWYLKQTDYLPGGTVPIVHQLRYGVFDSAYLQVDRVFSPKPWEVNMAPISMDYVMEKHYGGLVNVDKIGMTSAEIKVSSPTKLLDVSMPRILYEPQCSREFGAPDCGMSRPGLTVNGTVTNGDINGINTDLRRAEGYFNLGVIMFTSGPNYGVRRAVRYSTAAGNISFKNPLPKAPTDGDTFTIYPGCDKTRSKCAFYNNSNNFRGFPYIPVPETSL